MKKVLLLISVLFLTFVLLEGVRSVTQKQRKIEPWKFQSIDTMKYSRDLSREKLNDPFFDNTIDQQVKNIANTGTTHIAIATPYDEEFYPILERWVTAARKYELKVWFRGNFSGWEGWFDYPKITRAQHMQMTQAFIIKHRDLFEDGDVFTACPECENGGSGDPRKTGDIQGYRKFLIDEYAVTKTAFKNINKNIASNYNSMNGDVAKEVMDKKTTAALDGIVAIDHYVPTLERFISDIKFISSNSGGKIILGEFGAPIPDLNGDMTEREQADFIGNLLNELILTPEVIGLSYWTNVGGSTAIWNDNGSPKEAVDVIKSFYSAPIVSVKISNEAGEAVSDSVIYLKNNRFKADDSGKVSLPYFEGFSNVTAIANGYYPNDIELKPDENQTIILVKKDQDMLYKFRKYLKLQLITSFISYRFNY